MAAIDRHLATLAVANQAVRRASLEAVFAQEGLHPQAQTEETPKELHPIKNYLLLPQDTAPFPLFCAHYDCWPGSTGANDNAAAVCILIQLAKELARKGARAGFAFFDGEENGHCGAKLFRTSYRGPAFSAIINLDLCGYGDTIAVHSKGSTKKEGIRAFCDAGRLAAYNGKLVKYLPESDSLCFSTRKQPVLTVAAVPAQDIGYLNALATYNGSFLGTPPEFKMILGQMEVTSTIHGAFRDDIKWIQPPIMQQIFNYLLEAVTAPPEYGNRFRIFYSNLM